MKITSKLKSFCFDKTRKLFLPRCHAIDHQQNTSIDNAVKKRLRTFISWKDISGTEATLDDIAKLLKPLNTCEAIAWLSRLNADIENNGALNKEKQENIAHNLFKDDELFKKVIHFIKARDSLIINSAHIESIMRLAIVYCEGTTRTTNIVLDSLGRIILMFGDIADEDPELKAIHKQPTNIARDCMIRFIIRANNLHRSEDLRYSIARNIKLFREIPICFKDSPKYIDLNDTLNKALGITVNDYVACTLALISFWYNYDIITGKPEIFLNWDTLFKDTKIDKSTVAKYLDITSQHIDTLKAEISPKLSSTNSFQYDRLDIIKHPLIHIDNYLGCLSLDYLAGQLSEQLYWHCFDYFKKVSKRAHQAFTSFYGELVHKYVNDSFEKIYDDRYKKEISISGGQIDGLIIYPEDLIVIETKATKLMHETLISGDLEKFTHYLSKMISDKKGVYQLDKAINAIRQGELDKLLRLEASKLTIHPVLVLSDQLPLDPLLWNYYCDIIEASNWLRGENIKPLTIIDLEELDMLMSLKDGITILDVLKSKTENQISCAEPMKNYLIYNKFITQNRDLIDKFSEELCIASKTVYGVDLKNSSTQ